MSLKDRRHPEARRAWIARPRWRISLGPTIALGPGKAEVLEAIGRTGSISAGARDLGMSYRRAWLLVETMNGCFARPLIVTSKWRGGGARLTPDGRRVLRIYQTIERRSRAAARTLLADLQGLLKPPPARKSPVRRRRARSQQAQAARPIARPSGT